MAMKAPTKSVSRINVARIAAGSATLLTPGTAHCLREDVERFFEMVADPIEVDGDQWLSAQVKTSP